MIDIQPGRAEVAAGERLSGSAIWRPDRQVSPRAIVVSVGWRTEGRGNISRGSLGELRFPPGPGGFPPAVQLPFEFLIPPDGPVSYDGKLLRIIWEISVRVDVPWGRDEVFALPFRVTPRLLVGSP